MIIARRFSVTNFAIATSALLFQVFVLYPWHQRLDEDFQALKTENQRLLEGGDKARTEELSKIMALLDRLDQKKGTRS